MSILAPPLRPAKPPVSDPLDSDQPVIDETIIHGWRTVRRRDFAGNIREFEMPLTAEDVLHPQIGDEIMYSSTHQNICRYMGNVCIERTSDSDTTLVLTDTGVNLDLPEAATISPDIAVILNVLEPKKKWTVFRCGEEKTKPNLMIEITSPHRRSNDTESKFDYYYRAQIPCYVIIDLVNADANEVAPLLGYEWTDDGYQPMVLDARGRLWLPSIRVWLEAVPNGVACYDENDVLIRDFPEERKARQDAENRLSLETIARLKAEEKVREEAAARQNMEAQLQQMQVELARLRGDAKTS